MTEEWKTISHELLLSWSEDSWVVVRDKVQIDTQCKIDYTYIEHPGSVIIIPVLSENVFVMVEQYRYPIRQWSLEFPAGGVKKGEDAQTAARRELQEEVQYTAGILSLLGSFHTSNSITDEHMHVFEAASLAFSQSRGTPDEPSRVRIHQLSFEQIWHHICSGNISDGPTIIAALLWKERKR